jgi:hypothetical protein
MLPYSSTSVAHRRLPPSSLILPRVWVQEKPLNEAQLDDLPRRLSLFLSPFRCCGALLTPTRMCRTPSGQPPLPRHLAPPVSVVSSCRHPPLVLSGHRGLVRLVRRSSVRLTVKTAWQSEHRRPCCVSERTPRCPGHALTPHPWVGPVASGPRGRVD